jgi:hypothetical protein
VPQHHIPLLKVISTDHAQLFGASIEWRDVEQKVVVKGNDGQLKVVSDAIDAIVEDKANFSKEFAQFCAVNPGRQQMADFFDKNGVVCQVVLLYDLPMILSKNRWDSETFFALLEENYRQAFIKTTDGGIQVESSFIRQLQSNYPLTVIRERIGGFEIEGLDVEAVEACHQALKKKLSPSNHTAEEKVRVEKRQFQVLKMHGVHSLQMDIKLKFVKLLLSLQH